MVFKFFFDKRSSGSNTSFGAIKSESMPNQELVEELHKPIIRTLEKQIQYVWAFPLKDKKVLQLLRPFKKY